MHYGKLSRIIAVTGGLTMQLDHGVNYFINLFVKYTLEGAPMIKRRIPAFEQSPHTKTKILDAATKLFAMRGIGAVSLKDVAREVGIKSPTIFHYYQDKNALINESLTRFEKAYKEYFEWLSQENSRARSLEEVLDNMFNEEFMEGLNPVMCLGMSMALKSRDYNEKSREYAFRHIYEESVHMLQASFDRFVAEGVIPASDTKTLATLLMFCVTSGNEIMVHKITGYDMPFDCREVYEDLRKLISAALSQGILNGGSIKDYGRHKE
jgi:AcrR family transcriptional regulator